MLTKTASDHTFWRRDLLFLIVITGLLFSLGPGAQPLHTPEEGRCAEISREMVVSGDYMTPHLNGVPFFNKPILFFWLESSVIKLFGLHEWSLRLWPAMFALLGCLIVYGAGRRLFGRTTGLISSVVLSTNVFYYAESHYIRYDMMIAILLSAALLAFLFGVRKSPGRSRRFWFWGFYVCVALATLTKGLIGVVIPFMVIGVWVLVLSEWQMLFPLYLPSGFAIFLLIAAPWHILMMQAHPEFFDYYFIREHFFRYLTEIHHRNKPVWFFIPILLVGFLPWTAFLIQAIKQHVSTTWGFRRQHKEIIFFLVWIGVVLVFFSLSKSKLISYILPVLPPLALLIGHYLASVWEACETRGIRVGYLMLLAIAVLMTVFLIVLPFVLPFFHVVVDPQTFRSYQYAALGIVIGGAIVTWIVHRFRGFRGMFIALMITTALFLTIANRSSALFDTYSVKALAKILKPRLQPNDEIVAYHTYYHDLPVYLERRITVVEWRKEFSFGMTLEDTSDWMIDEATFWRRWEGASMVYMLTSRGNYEKLLTEGRKPFFLIAQTDRNVLVANREND